VGERSICDISRTKYRSAVVSYRTDVRYPFITDLSARSAGSKAYSLTCFVCYVGQRCEECVMLHDLEVSAQSSDPGDLARRWMGLSWLAVVVGGIYILSAKLSLALLTPDGVAVFWPAAGVAAGALIALGPRARWAVATGTVVATIVANLLGDRNLLSSVVFALCNAGEALLAAGLIDHYFGSPFSLDRLRHVLGLVGAAIVAAALSGIGGALGFAFYYGAQASFLSTWQNWFASDALGIVTIAPLVIGFASATREPPTRQETTEGLIALTSLMIMSVVTIALPSEPWTMVVPIALLFPILLWIAARCRPVFAAAAAFIVTLAIVWTTTIGIGYFGDPGLPMAGRVLAARAAILAVALCAYVLAALFAERRQHEAALSESEARLQEALAAGAVTTFVWDAVTGSTQRSANAAQILGFDRSNLLPRATFSLASIQTTASTSRLSCELLVPNAKRILPPSASGILMAVSSGLRKRQSANSTTSGALHASRGSLWTLVHAGSPKTNKECSSQRWSTA
jgi:integral membrane sensor domain MASE1